MAEQDAGLGAEQHRTLGSLSANDIGQVLTVRRGPATWTGILIDVRHHRGATSMRKVTTYTLAWRDSGTSILHMHNHHGREKGPAAMPDDSDTLCEVKPEPSIRPPETGADRG